MNGSDNGLAPHYYSLTGLSRHLPDCEKPTMNQTQLRSAVKAILTGYGKIASIAKAMIEGTITPEDAYIVLHKDFLDSDDNLHDNGKKAQQAIRMAIRRATDNGQTLKIDKEAGRIIVEAAAKREAGAGRPKTAGVKASGGAAPTDGAGDAPQAAKPGTGMTADDLIKRVTDGLAGVLNAFKGDEDAQRKLVDELAKTLTKAGLAVTLEPNF